MSDNPLFGLSQRQLPSNLSAEMALLGSMLANNRAYERVADFLMPQHFADPINGRIYEAITEEILSGHLADAVTLKNRFEQTGALEDVGGTEYLVKLLTAMISGMTGVSEYGRAIHDAWIKRELVEVGANIVNSAFGDEAGGMQQVEAAEQALGSLLGSSGIKRDRVVHIGDAVAAVREQIERMHRSGQSPAISTGMPTVDKAIGGLWPGNFVLLGGIPGSGKTSLATGIALSVAQRIHRAAISAGATPEEAKRQPGVSLFSLEMTADELAMRIAAQLAGVSVERLMRGDIDMVIAANLVRAQREVASLPLRIHECQHLSLRLFGAKLRMHLQRQAELVGIVDHLLVPDSGEDQKGQKNRGIEIGTIQAAARDMKRVAGDTGLPLLVLTHASRASATRTNPRPMMTDLKYAGEGDADVVFFTHRPVMFMSDEAPPKAAREGDEAYAKRKDHWVAEKRRAEHVAELVVAKRRMGPTGVHRLRWDGPTTSFAEFGDPDPGYQEYAA